MKKRHDEFVRNMKYYVCAYARALHIHVQSFSLHVFCIHSLKAFFESIIISFFLRVWNIFSNTKYTNLPVLLTGNVFWVENELVFRFPDVYLTLFLLKENEVIFFLFWKWYLCANMQLTVIIFRFTSKHFLHAPRIWCYHIRLITFHY